LNTLGGRIRLARKRAALTQRQLGDKLGVSPAGVTQWELDQNVPTTQHLPSISKVLAVTTDWLLTGKEDGPAAASKGRALTAESFAKGARLERVETPRRQAMAVTASIAANRMPTFFESQETELVDEKYARANHYCLIVKGQSMKPTIMEGDRVVVEKCYYQLDELLEEVGPADKGVWKALNREVVAVIINDEDPVLHRIYVTDKKDTGFRIRIRGDNPASQDIQIERDMRLKVLGIVKQIIRDPKQFE